MPPPPTHCQAVLGKGTLHSLVGLCGLHKLKVLLSGPQEEAVLLWSALGPTGFHLLATSLLEFSLGPKSLINA